MQFSVFSHLFVEAQLRKVINAADLDTYRAGKEILLNELGVVFNAGRRPPPPTASTRTWSPPRAPSTAAGSASAPPTSSGCCASRAPLGLGFDDLGKRRHGTAADAVLLRRAARGLRRPRTRPIAEGASYAVEHWAAAGFWKELIAGSRRSRRRECTGLPLAFWTWHDKVEDQHAAHTDDELVEAFAQPWFDEERFLAGAARDARRGAGVLGRALGRPRGGGDADDAPSRLRPRRPPRPRRHRPPRVVGGQRPRVRRLPRRSAFGFDVVAYAGPETGRRDRVSATCSQQGDVRFMVVRRAAPGHPDRRARPRATATASATSASSSTTSTPPTTPPSPGAPRSAREPANDERRRTARSTTPRSATYGDTVHTFLDRSAYAGPFAPQFEPTDLVAARRARRRASPGSTTSSPTSSRAPRRVGRLLRAGPRLRPAHALRRRRRSPPSTRR